ncbi:hypothetical protein ACFL60_05830 [Candidatus Omnitrophota bacterium]
MKKPWNRVVSWVKARPKWLMWLFLLFIGLLVFEPAKSAFIKVFPTEQYYETVFRKIKGMIVKGTCGLALQLEHQEWDMEQGSITFIITDQELYEHRRMNLAIESADGSKAVTFSKHSDNRIHWIFKHPQLGTVSRTTQLSTNDLFLGTFNRGPEEITTNIVFLAYTWDITNAETRLYVNNYWRDD